MPRDREFEVRNLYEIVTKQKKTSNQIKSDSKIEIKEYDSVQPLTEVRKGCCQL